MREWPTLDHGSPEQPAGNLYAGLRQTLSGKPGTLGMMDCVLPDASIEDLTSAMCDALDIGRPFARQRLLEALRGVAYDRDHG